MAIKELITRTGQWLTGKKNNSCEPLRKSPPGRQFDSTFEAITRKDESASGRTEALQMVQQSFEKFVGQLSSVNEHLSKHIKQNEELIQRIDEIPHLLQNFPDTLKNQKIVIDTLVEQLRTQALKSQQFTEAVEKIPVAAEKQTSAISEMSVQIAASAAVDTQMAEGFRKFNSITDKLKDNVEQQANSIDQLSRTFSASDNYLKYILNTQHKRFMWVFVAALGVSTFAIIGLLIVIFLLK